MNGNGKYSSPGTAEASLILRKIFEPAARHVPQPWLYARSPHQDKHANT